MPGDRQADRRGMAVTVGRRKSGRCVPGLGRVGGRRRGCRGRHRAGRRIGGVHGVASRGRGGAATRRGRRRRQPRWRHR
eukprot:4520448-Pleurochrysis_carterae.AAC.1